MSLDPDFKEVCDKQFRIYFHPSNEKAFIIFTKAFVWPKTAIHTRRRSDHYHFIYWDLQSNLAIRGQWCSSKNQGRLRYNNCHWHIDNKHFVLSFTGPSVKNGSYYERRERLVSVVMPLGPILQEELTDYQFKAIYTAHPNDIVTLKTNSVLDYGTNKKIGPSFRKGRSYIGENGVLYIDGDIFLDLRETTFTSSINQCLN